jgi:xylulokinase
VNGAGILYRWLKNNFMADGVPGGYGHMNKLAGEAPVGCEGLVFLPYGNGAERPLDNADVGAALLGLNFNIHGRAHVLRAAQEGVAFAMRYGMKVMEGLGLNVKEVRAGYSGMFLSPVFAEAFSTIAGAAVRLYETDGSEGAARGAGIGTGFYAKPEEAFAGLRLVKTVEPSAEQEAAYNDAYDRWIAALKKVLPQD